MLALAPVDAAKLALAGVIEERDVGLRTQLDVLDAQNAVLRAEEAVLSSRANRVLAGYSLVASIGRLNSETLDLNVEHYDPAANLKFGSGLKKLFGVD